jgi:hypothetical protein
MLSLKSARWSRLSCHFDELPAPTTCIAEWKAAIGTRKERLCYERLFNQYLHQFTILSCAYAVVPHVVAALGKMPPPLRLTYLCDVAWVETCRLTRVERRRVMSNLEKDVALDDATREHFRVVLPERCPELPPDLEADYLLAIRKARAMAIALLDHPWAPADFSRVLGILTALSARSERELARALLQPDSLRIEAEDEPRASISVLLSSRRNAR